MLYESLEYDKAISTGNLLLKSNYSFNKNDLYSDSSTIELPEKTILGFLNNCVYSAQEKLPQTNVIIVVIEIVIIKTFIILLKYLCIEYSFGKT